MSERVVGSRDSEVSKDKINSFEDLRVWQLSRQFTLDIYKATANFPKEEMYGLTSQIRRATVSVAANIAEGFSRKSNPNKHHFYNMSQSSMQEVKCYLILCEDLAFIDAQTKTALWASADQIGKMLFRLMETVRDA